MTDDHVITTETIGDLAMKAARLFAAGKIDNATSKRVISVSRRALRTLRSRKPIDDKSVAELLEVVETLNEIETTGKGGLTPRTAAARALR
jgi:hypothetical protein